MTTASLLPEDLESGYVRFRTGHYLRIRERYRELSELGQRPTTMVIACADSRSAPETVFDAGPGQLFVLRNVAALVPAYAPDGASHAASAALEFAVLALQVETIVVMGHGRCGGIAAALDPDKRLAQTDFIGTWVAGVRKLNRELDPAIDGAARQLALERRTIERSIENLCTFPWIANRVDDGTLAVRGAWFDIALGELHAAGPNGWQRIDVG